MKLNDEEIKQFFLLRSLGKIYIIEHDGYWVLADKDYNIVCEEWSDAVVEQAIKCGVDISYK